MPVSQALELARTRGLDLIEVAPTAVPPVCRVLDYGKYKYAQAKKERESKKSQKVSLLREVKLRPKIGVHDFDAKARSARKLLEGGDKVKTTILFRGREITHPDLGLKLLHRITDTLKDVAFMERPPVMEGKRISIILAPGAPAKAKPKEKEKKAEKEEVKNA